MTWILKGCPHCGGDTFLSKDTGNVQVENCLQCGYDAVKQKGDSKLHVVKPPKASCPVIGPSQIDSA